MGESRKPLPPRPGRQPLEDANSWVLNLIAWYDRAVNAGFALAELPPLTGDELQALKGAHPTVRLLGKNLGLLHCCEATKRTTPVEKGDEVPNGTEAPSASAGPPPASS